jgi:hypothetical protein
LPSSQPRDRRHPDCSETMTLARDANANFDIRAVAVASDP